MIDYNTLYSNKFPAHVDMPAGLFADVPYVFSVTNTDAMTLPGDGLVEGLRAEMEREAHTLGPYPHPQGHPGLRELIANNLKNKRGAEVSPDNIFLSCGAGGAIETIFDMLINPDDIVLLEEFCYLGSLGMLLARRADPIHIPTDERGMDTDALEGTLKALASRGKKPKLIYTISVYQNPTGVTLDLERRKRMVELSNEYGAPIFENESYADFRIDGPGLPPAMLGMDDEGAVTYVSAYTKLIGCGLRLGFAAFPEQMRESLTKLRYGTRPSQLAAMAVYGFLKEHQEEHIENVRRSISAKRDALMEALAENFPSSCSWNVPHGGMMAWAKLPDHADTWKALNKAVEAGVKYNPGGVFRADRGCNNYLRLTYSHNTPGEIREGVAILAEVFEKEGFFER